MDARKEDGLRPLFLALSREMETWAGVARGLEDRLERLATGARMTQADIRAVQDLDLLTQNLGQLSLFCGDLAEAGSISTALDRLTLAELKARLSGAEPSAASSGEPEIW